MERRLNALWQLWLNVWDPMGQRARAFALQPRVPIVFGTEPPSGSSRAMQDGILPETARKHARNRAARSSHRSNNAMERNATARKPRENPIPESSRHRFDATVNYIKAKGTRNEAERRYHAQLGMAACRRARDAYRRESGRLSAAMSYDLAELAMLAGEPGVAYAAASEGIAQPRVAEELRWNLADIMTAAIAAGRLPLPAVTAA